VIIITESERGLKNKTKVFKYKSNMVKQCIASVHDGHFAPCLDNTFFVMGGSVDIHRAWILCEKDDDRARYGYLVVMQVINGADEEENSSNQPAKKEMLLLNNGKIFAIQFPGYPVTFHLFFNTLSDCNTFFNDTIENVRLTTAYHDLYASSVSLDYISTESLIQFHMNYDDMDFKRCSLCSPDPFERIEFANPPPLMPHVGDTTMCCVCLDAMRHTSRRCTTLLCGHTLHTECLPRANYSWNYVLLNETWARVIKCPMCRFAMHFAEKTPPDISLARVARDLDEYYSVYDPMDEAVPAAPSADDLYSALVIIDAENLYDI